LRNLAEVNFWSNSVRLCRNKIIRNFIHFYLFSGFVIKESAQPFPVKRNTESAKREAYEKKLEMCEEEIKERLEQLHANRKKIKEELENPIKKVNEQVQPSISPTGNVENKSPNGLRLSKNYGSNHVVDKLPLQSQNHVNNNEKLQHTHQYSVNTNHLEDTTNKAGLIISNTQFNKSCNNCSPDRMNVSHGLNTSNQYICFNTARFLFKTYFPLISLY
jgi:hypothetical protein